MGLTETTLGGILKADGTLELDKKPDLPAGRVTVVLRQAAPEAMPPADDPFWQRMRAMWAIPVSSGSAADGGANTLSEVRGMREGWTEHQEAIERLRDGERIMRNPDGGSEL